MIFKLPQRSIVLLISAIFFSLAFEPSPLWFLACFFVPMFAASIRGIGWREGFRSGYVFGVVSAVLTLYWVVYVNVVGVLLLVLIHSFYYAFLGAIGGEMSRRYGRPALLILPILWAGMEYLRSLSEVSFPWQNVSYTQAPNTVIVQLAALGGDTLVTFFVLAIGMILYFAYGNLRRPVLSISLFVLAMFCYTGAYLWGASQFQPLSPDYRVAALQGNIPVNEKWQNGKADHNFVTYEQLSGQASDSARLLIWPESAAPMYLNLERPYISWIESMARRDSVDIMTGGLYMDRSGGNSRKYYNSAYLFKPSGMQPGIHHKQWLVPFGEHMPYAEVIGAIAKFREFVKERLALDISDFQPGDSIVVFESQGRHFGTLICFEVVYPEYVREVVNQGADFLAVITNDDWFGETAGPYQHFYIPVFRAVENRTWIVRAANTGICGIFDPYGRVVKKTQLGGRTFLAGEIGPRMGETFYSRHGAWVGKICLAMTLLCVLLLVVIKKRNV